MHCNALHVISAAVRSVCICSDCLLRNLGRAVLLCGCEGVEPGWWWVLTKPHQGVWSSTFV